MSTNGNGNGGIVDKIRKLLAKAEGTNNPHEAEIYSAKAEELMIRYGIETLSPTANTDEKIVTDSRLYEGMYYSKAQMGIGYAIANSLGLRGWYTHLGQSKKYRLTIVGFESDVQNALVLIDSLQMQALSAMRVWWKANRQHYADNTATAQLIERREFLKGFGNGAAARIRETRRNVTEEYAGTGTELVLLDRAKLVDNWVKERMTFSRAGRVNASGSYHARNSGYESGQRADIGGTRIANDRKTLK